MIFFCNSIVCQCMDIQKISTSSWNMQGYDQRRRTTTQISWIFVILAIVVMGVPGVTSKYCAVQLNFIHQLQEVLSSGSELEKKQGFVAFTKRICCSARIKIKRWVELVDNASIMVCLLRNSGCARVCLMHR
jgi:hypothetical protein